MINCSPIGTRWEGNFQSKEIPSTGKVNTFYWIDFPQYTPPPHKLVKISQYPIRKMSLRRYFNKYRDGRGFSLEIEGGLGKSGDGRGSKNFPSEKIADIAFAQHLEERTKRDERIKKPFSIPSALPITLLSLPFTFSFVPISAY